MEWFKERERGERTPVASEMWRCDREPGSQRGGWQPQGICMLRVAAATWPSAKLQALSNMGMLGEVLRSLEAWLGSDRTLF